jgi:glycosyltransferase involved in cell wall biosynthesis
VVSSEISIKKISLFNKSIQYAPHLFIPKVNLDYRKKNKLFTIFTTGRLVYWKGLDLIIDSFLKFNSIYPKSQLLIGGKGVELKRSRIDRILKENPNIKILGYAEDLNELYKRYIDCDVFIQPSLRDGTLFTILEAMYFAKPVITLDIPSFNELIPDSFGFKIKGSSEDELVELIFKKLSYYYENPEYARLMGKKAQEFAINNYSGDKFVNIIAEIYERLGSRAT